MKMKSSNEKLKLVKGSFLDSGAKNWGGGGGGGEGGA